VVRQIAGTKYFALLDRDPATATEGETSLHAPGLLLTGGVVSSHLLCALRLSSKRWLNAEYKGPLILCSSLCKDVSRFITRLLFSLVK
jgi:hypothetical protein